MSSVDSSSPCVDEESAEGYISPSGDDDAVAKPQNMPQTEHGESSPAAEKTVESPPPAPAGSAAAAGTAGTHDWISDWINDWTTPGQQKPPSSTAAEKEGSSYAVTK